MGKLFFVIGIFFILLGIGWAVGLGRLPGDVVIRRGNFTLFFPIVTSILLSIILTVLAWVFFSRR